MTSAPQSPEILSLKHIIEVCDTHYSALQEALSDLHQHPLSAPELEKLDKASRRLLDQFAYRYTRFQDDIGAKFIPALLRVLGEDTSAMPMIDRLNRLEQIGWLESAEDWNELRRIRNEFAHDYLDTIEERLTRLQLAMEAAERMVEIYQAFIQRLRARADLGHIFGSEHNYAAQP